MSSDWKRTTVGALLSRDGGELRTGPFGTSLKAEEYTKSGVPVIAVRDIGVGYIRIDEKTPRVPPEVVKRLEVFKVVEGDILFGRKGAVERMALVTPKESGWLMGSDCIRLRLPTTVNPRFVIYAFQNPAHRTWMVRHATGSTMASLNQQILELIPLYLPPLPEQRAIAHILGTLDDKIELNRQMNQTLEEMARALFQSWFVDFDPVHAKARGEPPPGLDPTLADLFPDHFVETKIGLVPAGWRMDEVGNIVTSVGGGTPSTQNPEFWEDGIHYFATPKDMSNLQSPILLETERKVTDAGITKISSGLLPIGTVLMSSRAPIGYLAIADVPVCINQGFIAMVCDGLISNYYMLNWAHANMDVIKGNAGGTTFAEISKKNFRPIPAVVPSREILFQFDSFAQPLYAAIANNERESQTLAELRDTLLPKLMSGELRVPDAAAFVEEVAA